MTDGPSAFWDDLNRAEIQAWQYVVTARTADGQPVGVTIGPVEGAIYYNEYLTGPHPWWKRAWRLLRRAA